MPKHHLPPLKTLKSLLMLTMSTLLGASIELFAQEPEVPQKPATSDPTALSTEIDDISDQELYKVYDESKLDEEDFKYFVNHSIEFGTGIDSQEILKEHATFVRYKPQFHLSNLNLNDDVTFNFDTELDIGGQLYYYDDTNGDLKNQNDVHFNIYRMWARFTYSTWAQITLGRMQIRFGNGYVFRPLAWFDDIKFTDALRYSVGRNAIVVSMDPTMFSRVTLWGLYGNDTGVGYSDFITYDKSVSYGGRLEQMARFGMLGISALVRDVGTGTNGLGKERNAGVDARVDILLLSLFSDFSYTKMTLDKDGSLYQTRKDLVAGGFIMAPIDGINYYIYGEYFQSIKDTNVADFEDNDFYGYDVSFGFRPNANDSLSLIWLDGHIYDSASNASQVARSLIFMWRKSFDHLSFGLNLFANYGFVTSGSPWSANAYGGLSTEGVETRSVETFSDRTYGVEGTIKYVF